MHSKIPLDSLHFKGQISIQTIDTRKTEFFKLSEPSVQAALIIAGTTIITVALGFWIKDYWIPNKLEKNKKDREQKGLFNRYKTNLISSACILAHRLSEIYRIRSHYLWDESSEVEFYQYKYRSSVYRLCVVLGWIRAYKLEQENISTGSTNDLYRISKVINAFSGSLADGQGIEMYVAKSILNICLIDYSEISESRIQKFSVSVDHIIHKYISSEYEHVSDLPTDKKEKFLIDLENLMASNSFSKDLIQVNSEKIISIVSVKLALIYRDWQQAIGDLMIEQNTDKGINRFNVIGYKQFEEIYMSGTDEQKRWIKRAEKLFRNLNVNENPDMDSRIAQLSNTYSTCYKLIEELHHINIGTSPLSKEDFDKLASTIN